VVRVEKHDFCGAFLELGLVQTMSAFPEMYTKLKESGQSLKIEMQVCNVYCWPICVLAILMLVDATWLRLSPAP